MAGAMQWANAMLSKYQLENYYHPKEASNRADFTFREDRNNWLKALYKGERDVVRDQEGREYVVVSSQDEETQEMSSVPVYLPTTIQNHD